MADSLPRCCDFNAKFFCLLRREYALCFAKHLVFLCGNMLLNEFLQLLEFRYPPMVIRRGAFEFIKKAFLSRGGRLRL
jgi:hypothetical protein